jgi:hypothetical protein
MSTIIASNVSDGTLSIPTTYVTNGSAKAHVLYNQATPAILSSLNVSSLTDNAAGRGIINFTSAMISADGFNASGMNNDFSAGTFYAATIVREDQSASSHTFQTGYTNDSFGEFADAVRGGITYHGDLA